MVKKYGPDGHEEMTQEERKVIDDAVKQFHQKGNTQLAGEVRHNKVRDMEVPGSEKLIGNYEDDFWPIGVDLGIPPENPNNTLNNKDLLKKQIKDQLWMIAITIPLTKFQKHQNQIKIKLQEIMPQEYHKHVDEILQRMISADQEKAHVDFGRDQVISILAKILKEKNKDESMEIISFNIKNHLQEKISKKYPYKRGIIAQQNFLRYCLTDIPEMLSLNQKKILYDYSKRAYEYVANFSSSRNSFEEYVKQVLFQMNEYVDELKAAGLLDQSVEKMEYKFDNAIDSDEKGVNMSEKSTRISANSNTPQSLPTKTLTNVPPIVAKNPEGYREKGSESANEVDPDEANNISITSNKPQVLPKEETLKSSPVTSPNTSAKSQVLPIQKENKDGKSESKKPIWPEMKTLLKNLIIASCVLGVGLIALIAIKVIDHYRQKALDKEVPSQSTSKETNNSAQVLNTKHQNRVSNSQINPKGREI